MRRGSAARRSSAIARAARWLTGGGSGETGTARRVSTASACGSNASREARRRVLMGFGTSDLWALFRRVARSGDAGTPVNECDEVM